MSNEIELLIEDYIDRTLDDLPSYKNKEIGRVIDAKDLIYKYLGFLKNNAKDLSSLDIVVDCAHGSASVVARKLFSDLLDINAVYINESFNGVDINLRSGSTHIEHLVEEVKKGQYDLGVAFDGDADRLIVVSPTGKIIDGDNLMYLSALNLKKHGALTDNKVVFTTMSNLGLKIALKKENIDFIEVDVGDKNVQACLKLNKLPLGGEQSGHIIYYNDLNTGDGLLSAIKVMNILVEENKSLDELVKNLHILPQLLKNEVVVNKAAVMESDELKAIICEVQNELGENGRILVRPSGTEQLIRVMVEAETKELCELHVNKVIALVKELSS